MARDVHDRAAQAGHTAAEATAWRAMGWPPGVSTEIPEAVGYMRAAVEAAERASDVNLAAEARLSLAAALMLAGDTEEAMTRLDAARATGRRPSLVASQRAMALGMLGRYEEARQAYGPVIAGFRRLGDRVR